VSAAKNWRVLDARPCHLRNYLPLRTNGRMQLKQSHRRPHRGLHYLKRYKHLDFTGAFTQWLKCFSYHSSKHTRAVSSLHGVARRGRTYKKVPRHNRTVLRRDFARNDSDNCQRDFIVG
jgi:hypothetical protein